MTILTGPKIREEIEAKRISIDPYQPERVGPNSVDLHIAPELRTYTWVIEDREADQWAPASSMSSAAWGGVMSGFKFNPLDAAAENSTASLTFPENGRVLKPGILYLARTVETIHTDHYVPIVEGRSSFGRLGLHVHVTAGFCDVGFCGTITLEMHVIHPLRIYHNVPICQVYFLKPEGAIQLYAGKYQGQHETTPSRMHLESRRKDDLMRQCRPTPKRGT